MAETVEVQGAGGRRVIEKGYTLAGEVAEDLRSKLKKMTLKELKAYIKEEDLDIQTSNYSKKSELMNVVIDIDSNKG